MAENDDHRQAIEAELPELAARDARMKEAAEEGTVSAHVRRAIHQSRRPLTEIGGEAGVSIESLCGFLEGERTLRSDVLDRLAQAGPRDHLRHGRKVGRESSRAPGDE